MVVSLQLAGSWELPKQAYFQDANITSHAGTKGQSLE
jgi:hypothetical protein